MSAPLTVSPILGLPEITPGADLAQVLAPSLRGLELPAVLVLSSKVVSKAMGLIVVGRSKDHVVQDETARVVAERAVEDRVTRIVESVAGPVMAAAGVDASNTGAQDALLTLPRDADAYAADLRRSVLAALGQPQDTPFAVIITDTAGRPWRAGVTDFSLGSAGIAPLLDHRGERDHDGRELSVTIRCLVDELAAAADLVKGKNSGVPAAIVTGVPAQWCSPDAAGSASVIRTGASDFFAWGHKEAIRWSLGVVPGSADSQGVGIVPVSADGLEARAGRAIALALFGVEDGAVDVGISDGAGHRLPVTLSAPDDLTLGLLISRLEVAAHSEDLRLQSGPSGAAPGVVELCDALVDPR